MVLVDEFQDTNERQYELLDTIGGSRLFMVGDEWQSIYRFRGADVDVFRARRSDPDNGVLPMRENFRSAAPVLDVVNEVFGHGEVFGSTWVVIAACFLIAGLLWVFDFGFVTVFQSIKLLHK